MTKAQERMFLNHRHAIHHTIWDAYDRPSYAKEKAYEWCVEKAQSKGAFEWSIPTHNTFNFTFAFLYVDKETGEIRMGYETHANSFDFAI